MKRITIFRFAIALLLTISGGWHSASNCVSEEPAFQNEYNRQDVPADQPITVSAWYRLKEGSREGNLFVRAVMGDGYHCYSQNHKGPEVTSSFKVSVSDQFEVNGGFEPDVDPHAYEKDGEYCEEFAEEVTWSAPIKLAQGVDPASLPIDVAYSGMVCNATGCQPPLKIPLVAKFDGYEAGPQVKAKFRPTMSHVLFLATLQRVEGPGAIQPGDKLTLDITAEPEGEYHIYPYQAAKSEGQEDFPTLIAFTKRNGWSISGPTVSDVPEEKSVGDQQVVYHHDPVTFSYEIEIPSAAEEKMYAFNGTIGFQTCTDIHCDHYDAVEFTVDVPVGGDVTGVIPVSFTGGAKYEDVQAAAGQFVAAGQKSAGQWEGMTLPVVLPLAFLAGLILNIMPCVLPVIGLKIMSFVQQAGENPFRVFMLNVVFALGMIFVFLILATLAVFFGYGWGELYESLLFKTIMICVVFVFGLSFFGVWEIPLPGFVGSGAASKAAEKEGMAGAFLKGVLTTLLATPCSGPLLIPAVVWAIAQPPLVTYLVFLRWDWEWRPHFSSSEPCRNSPASCRSQATG